MRIEWDAAKDRDREHSDDEDRFLAIGAIARGVVVVWYVEPAEDVVRIIGARMATRAERALFSEHARGRGR